MLRKRLIASFFMITPVLLVFWLDANPNFGRPGTWIVPLIILASLVIANELLRMIGDRTAGATSWVAYVGTLLCSLAVVFPELLSAIANAPIDRWLFSGIAIGVTIALAFGHELVAFHENRPSTKHIALTLFVVLYSGWCLSFLSAMRLQLDNYKGALALFSVLFIIKMSDAGAYFVGKNLGKHKLAPVLSPGKTIEGLFGGIAAAVFAAWVVFGQIMPRVLPSETVSWPAAFGYAVTICLVGVAGDLSESLIKRDMRCKDSSGWLPGLGGIMDTADSVLLAAPVAYLWWMSGLL